MITQIEEIPLSPMTAKSIDQFTEEILLKYGQRFLEQKPDKETKELIEYLGEEL
jgi:hypothetical protein